MILVGIKYKNVKYLIKRGETDMIDDCHEYLILHFKDGTERLFCNSYVDLFIS